MSKAKHNDYLLMRNLFKIFLSLCITNTYAQKVIVLDSVSHKNLEEIVVTATRSERKLGSLSIPVTLIGQQQIKTMGSLRLNDVLAEQTGLFIQNDHGQGVQIQGFSPDYTLILVDGEPLIGRTAGTLELSRLAVGNIKQIEIVKGPSSSLYGSEALAGVINIITNRPEKAKGDISLRYGTNQVMDFSGNIALKINKLGLSLFMNHYKTNGYDFSPEVFGATVSPFQNTTFSPKVSYDFSEKIKFSMSGRLFVENQENALLAANEKVTGWGKVTDWNLTPILRIQLQPKLKVNARYYTSRYRTNSTLVYQKNDDVYDNTFFIQTFQRPEVQLDYALSEKQNLTVGLGQIWESVEATRYEGTKRFDTKYAFLQYENSSINHLNLTIGGRFDAHSAYESQLSPKFSAGYQLTPEITLRGSVGVGFKAPDFRQLYLNFTNAVAGYSVLGTQEVINGVAKLQAENQISEMLFDVNQLSTLKAESSLAFNLGSTINLPNSLKISVNAFRNDINNLIQTQAIARKTNGQNVFSYLNLNKVFTQGIEAEFSKQVILNQHSFTWSFGYQFLEAKDKEIVSKIENGEVFRRDPISFQTVRVKASEYEGLFNRSNHSGNIKVFYENKKNNISSSLRGVYRSRYGFADFNGNSIADTEDEFVNGYFLWNFSINKTFKDHYQIQMGCDNIAGFTDPQRISNLAGRLIWLSLGLKLEPKKRQ